MSDELVGKLSCFDIDLSSAVWTAQEDAMLSCLTLKANRMYGSSSYFCVKVPFLGMDHYVDVNVMAGSLDQVKVGEYPDFYIALPAYGVGEKRMYAQKLRVLLARDNPKKKIGVMFTSVRVHGKKGLVSAAAVYGLAVKPDTVTLGKFDFRTFGKLEELTEELRSSRPQKVLSYSLNIAKDKDLGNVLSGACEHITFSGGEGNLVGHFLDEGKKGLERHIFLVSSPLKRSNKFSFILNTRGSSGSVKKPVVSSSQAMGSQI